MADYKTLVLKPSGTNGCQPNKEPWKPKKNKVVMIVNVSGADQTLTNIDSDLFTPSVSTVTIKSGDAWYGFVNAKKGDYHYQDGVTALSTRTGTIDPS